MAVQCDFGGNRDDIKNHFITREGAYKVITFSEYRPSRPGCMAQCQSFPVRVSFVALPADNSMTTTTAGTTTTAAANTATTTTTTTAATAAANTVGIGGGGAGGSSSSTATTTTASSSTINNNNGGGDRICFNVGRELYVYMYKGLRKMTPIRQLSHVPEIKTDRDASRFQLPAKMAADLTKPIDKRVYKGTYPTCHDFNVHTMTSRSVSLLVGFSAGQIQLIDPIKKELSKLFNEERLIDKSKVTCVKWLPGSPSLFLVAHASGQMYVYNEELTCGNTPPSYQLFKQGEGFSIYTCKTKSTRNPLYRWVVGEGALHEFAFSPCCRFVATVSQDGFLRVFNYDTMDLVGVARSYFGGLLCVCWSPDGKYVVTGGEDDLVTVWSFAERRVVARGHGHKSWVSVVSFDAYTTTHLYGEETSTGAVQCFDFGDGVECHQQRQHQHRPNGVPAAWSNATMTPSTSNNINASVTRSIGGGGGGNNNNSSSNSSSSITCYRFGSVGQDTQLCLWDLTEDVLKQPLGRSRTTVLLGNCCSASSAPTQTQTPPPPSSAFSATATAAAAAVATAVPVKCCNSVKNNPHCASNCVGKECADGGHVANAVTPSKFATMSLSAGGGADRKQSEQKEHKRNFSLTSRNSDKNSVIKSNHHHQKGGSGSGGGVGQTLTDGGDPVRLIGTTSCPRLDDVPLLEPLVCKKVAHERLTALVFREECIVSACQEGFICTWARPGRVVSNSSNAAAASAGSGPDDRSGSSPT